MEAARLGLAGLAVTDHDGLYGVGPLRAGGPRPRPPHRLRRRADARGSPGPPNGEPDPEGEHLLVLAEGPVGYARLARAISEAQLAGEKGAPRTTVDALADAARAPVHLHPQPSARNDSWFVLTGCRKGTVPAALVRDGPAAARARARAARRRASDATACWWSCGTTATRSTVTATTRWRGWRCAAGRRRGRHQQRALRHSRAAPARHRARGGPRAPLARRDRRLAPGGAVRAPAQRGASRHVASHAGRARSSAPSTSRRVRVRPQPRRARAPRPRRARRPHRDELAARAHRARRGASATRRRTRTTSRRCARSRTSST